MLCRCIINWLYTPLWNPFSLVNLRKRRSAFLPPFCFDFVPSFRTSRTRGLKDLSGPTLFPFPELISVDRAFCFNSCMPKRNYLLSYNVYSFYSKGMWMAQCVPVMGGKDTFTYLKEPLANSKIRTNCKLQWTSTAFLRSRNVIVVLEQTRNFFFVFCKRKGMGWGCSYDELRGRECKVAVRFFAPLRPVPILVPPLRQECLQSMIKKVLARGHFIQQVWYQSFALQKNPGTTVFSSFHFVKGQTVKQ